MECDHDGGDALKIVSIESGKYEIYDCGKCNQRITYPYCRPCTVDADVGIGIYHLEPCG